MTAAAPPITLSTGTHRGSQVGRFMGIGRRQARAASQKDLFAGAT